MLDFDVELLAGLAEVLDDGAFRGLPLVTEGVISIERGFVDFGTGGVQIQSLNHGGVPNKRRMQR